MDILKHSQLHRKIQYSLKKSRIRDRINAVTLKGFKHKLQNKLPVFMLGMLLVAVYACIEEVSMAVRYNKLFKMMIDRKMSNAELASEAGVSLNIITRLKRDQYIAMDTIEKICQALECV